MTEPKDTDWMILNAINCWLHYFPDHPRTEQYKELRQRFEKPIQEPAKEKEIEPQTPRRQANTGKSQPTTRKA